MQRSCQHCFAKERQGVPLKVCSACKKAHYCSAECQRAAWAQHKPVCAMNQAGRDAATQVFGVDIEGDYKKWLRNARPVLTLLVHKMLGGRYDTHVIHIGAKYQPDKEIQFKVDQCFALSVTELRELNAVAADSVEQYRSNLAQRMSAGKMDSVTGFAMVLCNDGKEAAMMRLVPLGVSLDAGSAADSLWNNAPALSPRDQKMYVDALNAGKTML